MGDDKATTTSTDHYDSEGNFTGHSESTTQPESDFFGDTIDTTIDVMTGGALSSDSDSSSSDSKED